MRVAPFLSIMPPGRGRYMDRHKIQKLIDDEKPAFDFARMMLTAIAWWTLLLFIGSTVYAKGTLGAAFFSVPVMGVGGLFGLVLLARLNILVERVSAEVMAGASGSPRWLRWPVLAIATILPMACAWIVVWALMFTNFPQ